MSTLSLQNINKVYPNKVQAVFDFNLDIKDKEFIVFVGPSGCGKSTTLRMVAGLEDISAGELYIDGEYMNNTAPKDRNIAMVFQSYALYPHMTVYKNMAFALQLRKTLRPLYHPSEEVDAIMAESKLLMAEVNRINRAFKKKQNANELLPARADLYKQLFANQAKIEAISKPVIGIDEYGIKTLQKSIKKIEKDINGLNKTLNRENAATGKDRDEEYIHIIESAIEQKKNQIEKETKELEYLKANEVPLRKPRHLSKYEIDLEVNKAAESIDLVRYLFRKPGELSGGQRQRVALGRAIVRKPKVFLMDEPLSNLDAKLRVQTRGEILKIHEAVGATTIYVTHDQTEAMTMADRIVVMKDGYVQQIGSPDELYGDPDNQFVAGFIGSPAMNFIIGTITEEGITFKKELTDEERAEGKEEPTPMPFKLSDKHKKLLNEYIGKKVVLGIRPEHIRIKKTGQKSDPIKVTCEYCEVLGSEAFSYTFIAGQRICFKTFDKVRFKRGEEVDIYLDDSSLYFFDAESGKRIR